MGTISTTATITVDLQHPEINTIHAKQFDSLSRYADIKLLSGGQPWTAESSISYAIQYAKPDGTKGMYDKLPDGATDAVTAGTDDTGCTVLRARFAPQMLTVAGRVRFSVAMLQTDGTKLQTFSATLEVEPSEVNGDTSKDYYKMVTIDELLDEVKKRVKSVNNILPGTNGDVYINAENINTQVPSLDYLGSVEGALEALATMPSALPVARASSGDGIAYTATNQSSGALLPTVSSANSVEQISAVGKGRQIVFIPLVKNQNDAPTLQLNGGEIIQIRIRAPKNQGTDDSVPTATLPVSAGALMRGVPYTMTFCGKYWLLDSQIAQFSCAANEYQASVMRELAEVAAGMKDADIIGVPIINSTDGIDGDVSSAFIKRSAAEYASPPEDGSVRLPTEQRVEEMIRKDITADYAAWSPEDGTAKTVENYAKTLPDGSYRVANDTIGYLIDTLTVYGYMQWRIIREYDDEFCYISLYCGDYLGLYIETETGYVQSGGRTLLTNDNIPLPTASDAGKVPVASGSGNYVLKTFEAAKDGKSAYQYAQDGGYTGTETEFAEKLAEDIPAVDTTLTVSGAAADAKEAGTRLSALSGEIVDQQKLLDNFIASGGFSAPIVDSVDEMVDTSKQYILKSTGTIWAYKSATTEQEVTITDELDDTTYYDNSRLGSSATGLTDGFHNDATGYHITPLIDLTKAKYQGKTIQIHFEGAKYITSATETWIQHRYYKTDRSVQYARGYSSPSDSGSVGTWKNATITINSETSATIEIAMPLLCGSANVQCGYLRFCGKGTVADSHIYITYKETQTVTSEQWVDTGIQYGGGGLDEETAAKISELNNEGSDPSTIKLLSAPVLDFYNSDVYPDNDYTVTHLQKITYPCRADIPVPYTVKWGHNENAMRTTVAVDKKSIGNVNAYTMRTYDATGMDNYPIYNLLPNTTYYYKVTHVLSDGSLVEAKSGSFTTSAESWRLLYIDGTQNVRDLGGWTGLNGKKVKYGKIIRGAAFSESSSPGFMLTGKGRQALAELKIQAELNLGAVDSKTSIASNVAYKKVYYTNYAIAITDQTYRTMFKTLLEYIVSCLDGTLAVSGLSTVERNIYMHCQGGCDRTGTLSFLLLGLLGVSESDLAKEYELSSFSDVGFGRLRTTTKAVDVYDYVGMVEALKTYSGNTITDKFVDFAINGCGISSDTIDSFRALMLE